MNKTRNRALQIVKLVLVFAIVQGVGSLLRVGGAILQGHHGAPSFVTPVFIVYGLVSEIFMIIAFLLLAKLIPVKSKVIRSVVFMLFFWGSAYLPQVLGMLGGHSAVLAGDAFSIGTIAIDSLSYMVKGLILSVFLSSEQETEKRTCNGKRVLVTCLISMLLFPAFLIILELVAGLISPQLYCYNAFVIDAADRVRFYIIFYLFQALSGLIFPIFYRTTEYNNKQRWFQFASTYIWCLWMPIVLIVALFGVPVYATIIWGVLMAIALYLDFYIFIEFMNKSIG